MGLTFCLGTSTKDIRHPEGYVLSELELTDYLLLLTKYLGVDVTLLNNFDPYSDTILKGQQLIQLDHLLAQLLTSVEKLFQQQILPTHLEPPKVVGLEISDEGEPCGRDGVLRFLQELKLLCDKAKTSSLSLLILGD